MLGEITGLAAFGGATAGPGVCPDVITSAAGLVATTAGGAGASGAAVTGGFRAAAFTAASFAARSDSSAASAFASPCKRSRTFTATSTGMELEWVFFSVTPNPGRRSIMALALTSSSRASSLMRTWDASIMLLRNFSLPAAPPACCHPATQLRRSKPLPILLRKLSRKLFPSWQLPLTRFRMRREPVRSVEPLRARGFL